jgi:hypothetical protein
MVMEVSERRVCRVAGQRRTAPPDPYRDRLVARMRELALEHPRRRRRIMDLMRKERWSVGTRLRKRLWRQLGAARTPEARETQAIRHGREWDQPSPDLDEE